MEAELQPQREVELAEPPDFLQARAAREVEPRQPRVNAKPANNSGHRPASSTATPAAEFHKGPSRPQDISINTRLEEPLGEQSENLAGYLKQKPAEVSDIIHVFASAADALVARYAERKKFVGLSPKNICFDRLGKATIQDLSSTVLTGSTMDGAVGSMRYAPPEIFVEKSGIEAPAASDIYTLGFIFYEILLGSDLFRATFPSQRSDLDWLRWHADPKSKATPLKQLLPSHPTALSELLESMIAKEPATRLSDPAVVLSRLRSIAQQSNKTIIAQKPMQHSKKPKATSFRQSKRNMKGITMIALAVVLAVSALFVQRHPELWRHLSQMYHQLRVPSAEEIPQSTR
jgi:serine/threonine protein kinase